jgi:SAM-dependent MidA family methyltransferase
LLDWSDTDFQICDFFEIAMTTPGDYLLKALAPGNPPLPFEKFMEAALYHSDFGYYSTEIQNVGKVGDFSTSATLSPILAEAIANWLKTLPPLPAIEIGAGNGTLAEAILQHHSTTYHIVETSKPLRALQQERLNHSCIWHDTIQSALQATNGNGHLISNELVDSFPCKILEYNGNQWEEIALKLHNGNLRETTIPFTTKHLLPSNPQPGQRIELHQSYHTWLHSWAKLWKQGHSLTIDYGDTLNELYYRRPQGSLRAYYQQQRLTGPQIYHRMGQQDLTADVNFTHLQHWSQQLHWKTHPLQTQRDFILQYTNPNPDDSASQFLIHPEGAGEAFKVLICENLTQSH